MSAGWQAVVATRRLVAQEQGTIIKDWGGKFPIALIYPNHYRVAMSSLGFQNVYRLLNAIPEVVCERVVYGAPELAPHDSIDLSIESQRPLDSFPVLAFTLPFELDYLNAIDALRSVGLPLSRTARDDSHPLLLAGGPAITANPLPLSTIFDAVGLGEGEIMAPEIARALVTAVPAGRAAALRALADIPGVYVPALHGPADAEGAMQILERRWTDDLDAHPTHSVVLSRESEFGQMYLIEIARGCVRHCPFCLAGHTFLPHRQRSLPSILDQAREGLRYRDRIGLVSAAVSDYRPIDALVAGLREIGARLSVSSLRVKPLSEALFAALAQSGDQTITLAPEAGSERMRQVIQKGVTREDIVLAAESAQRNGFRQLKLYFMIGLPTETDDDVVAIASLVGELARVFVRRIAVNVTPFVPKAQTPFQLEMMQPEREVSRRVKLLERELRGRSAELRSDSPKWSIVQGVLARGDRRLSVALEGLDGTSLRDWRKVLDQAGLQVDDYLRARAADEALPWGKVRC